MRLLPIVPAVTHMWQSTYHNLWFALRAQWPWFVLLALLFSLLFSINDLPLTGKPEELEAHLRARPEKAGIFLISMILGVGTAMLAFASIAVSWHRYVLLDEVPKGLARFRVDSIVWRYMGNMILLGLVMVVVALPMTVVMSLSVFSIGLTLAYIVLVMLPLIYRLSIKLPAIALGRRDFSMKDAWNVSRGNWNQIVGVAALYSGASWMIGMLLVGLSILLVTVFGPVVGFWIDIAIQSVINWVVTVMGITLLTSLYGFFVEKRDF